jgi:uncharacterized protein (DUF58 family)
MLIVFTFASAVGVGLVASLATNNWIFLVLAITLHLVVTAAVLAVTFRATNSGDKPDPVTEAHIEAGDRPAKKDGLTESGRRGDREVVL